MVQVINYSPQQAAADERMRSNLSKAISQPHEFAIEEQQYQRNRGRLQNALSQVSGSAKQNQSPLDTTLSFLNAMAGIPGSERYVGQILPQIIAQAQAANSQKVNLGGGNDQPASQIPGQQGGQPRQQMQVPQRQPLPNFGQQPGQPQEQANKFFPNNVGPQEAPGNLPQAATSGEKLPIKNQNELLAEGKRIAKEYTAAGLPTTVAQGYDIAKSLNEDNKNFNSQVEQERKERVISQREYGNRAVENLTKVMPEATDEMKAIFKKKGENAAGQGKSEAEIDRTLAKEAVNFKNTVANIRNDLSAPRTQNTLQRKFLGTSKDFDEASNDLRVKLKPLLDLGLYDTARNLLNEKGYYPEERESILNPLSGQAAALAKQIPQASQDLKPNKNVGYAGGYERSYSPETLETLQENLTDILSKDPNASLVLLRKSFEDKGYDWRAFKDAVNEAIQDESIPGFPNQDQFNQLHYLDHAPLNLLETLLYKLGGIGR